MRPLRRDVAALFPHAGPCQRGLQLLGVHMHLGLREVAQRAGVIQVQVGGHDVAHVARVQPQFADLVERGFRHHQLGPDRCIEAETQARGAADVRRAQACVHEDQAMAPFDQQAVATHVSRGEPAAFAIEQPPPQWAH